VNKNKHISIDDFTKSFAEVPDSYFQNLEENIIHNTVHKAELQEKLWQLLQTKPKEFGIVAVPESYFESLNQTILKQTATNATEVFWQQAKSSFEFEVPNAYFEQLSTNIKNRIPVQKQPQEKWLWLPELAKQPIYLLAAAMVMALGLAYFQLNSKTVDSFSASIESLTKEDISIYIASKSDEIDIESIPETNWETADAGVPLQAQYNNIDVNDILFEYEL